jgi:hypothetical protein
LGNYNEATAPLKVKRIWATCPQTAKLFREEEFTLGQEQEPKAEEIALIIRLLTRRLQQELPLELESRILPLSLSMLEELAEALLDFRALSDLEQWLAEHEGTE